MKKVGRILLIVLAIIFAAIAYEMYSLWRVERTFDKVKDEYQEMLDETNESVDEAMKDYEDTVNEAMDEYDDILNEVEDSTTEE